jgi:hypothetical protein
MTYYGKMVSINHLFNHTEWQIIQKLPISTMVHVPSGRGYTLPNVLKVSSNTDCSRTFIMEVKKKSHYRPMGPRGFWEVKAFRFPDIGT